MSRVSSEFLDSIESSIDYVEPMPLESSLLKASQTPKNTILQAKDINISFLDSKKNAKAILKNINFEIKEHEFVSVIGDSGCGKSTLLKILAGYLRAGKRDILSGEVIFKGQRHSAPNADISVMFQHSTLYPWLSIEKNVAFPLKMRAQNARKTQFFSNLKRFFGFGRLDSKNVDTSQKSLSHDESPLGNLDSKDSIDSKVKEYLKMVSLESSAKKYPYECSGGMQARAALAQVLACESKLILMDEPLSALDAFSKRAMQDLIRHIYTKLKSSVFFITHDIEEALYLSNRIFILKPLSPSLDSNLVEILDVDFNTKSREEFEQSLEVAKMKEYIYARVKEKYDYVI